LSNKKVGKKVVKYFFIPTFFVILDYD